MTRTTDSPLPTCPPWCVLQQQPPAGQRHRVHRSTSLRVGPTLMRLQAPAATGTVGTGTPVVLVGRRRHTLYEAEALIDALTQLVDSGHGLTPDAGAGRHFPGP